MGDRAVVRHSMKRIFFTILFSVLALAQPGHAQQTPTQELFWVQIEAQPSLNQITTSLREHSAELEDVNGFELGGGWYGMALGPYVRSDAKKVLNVLRAEGRIPRDSFIAASSEFRRQIWPVGSDVLSSLQAATPFVAEPEPDPEATTETAETTTVATTQPASEPELAPELADETPREARASERTLNREERAALQVALRWAGFYEGKIDADFGPGTRGSMTNWQSANGYEPSGILTTLQRADLIGQYNSVLEGLDIQIVSSPEMGIEMKLPMGAVAFSRFEPPFAHYDGNGDIPARVLLISQEGNQDTMFGLYDIMQTLQIVPQNGPRERKKDGFVLVGESATAISHTEVTLKNGQIKGFTLVWPAGDEERRKRLLGVMQSSFSRIDGVLDPTIGWNDEQSIDLISGLEVRKPILSRSGFYVDNQGAAVTTSEVLSSCGRITIDDDYDAELVVQDDALGIAILRPKDALAPMTVAAFQQSAPRLKSDIAVAGYSYGGILGDPTLTFGELADLRGLNGEDNLNRLALTALAGDAGGPVLDAGGAVLGMLLPNNSTGRQLPDGVSFAANAAALQSALQDAGIRVAATSEMTTLTPAALSDRAVGMTVLVSCWE